MDRKLALDINTFIEDSKSSISFEELSSHYISKDRNDLLKGIESISYPQTIEFEFSNNFIVESHQIFSSDPLIFRYVYQGEFIYDDSTGELVSARFDKATAMFFDPENGEEYGYTHLPTKNGGDSITVVDTRSLISWGEATDKLFIGTNIVDEYEKPGRSLPVKNNGVLSGDHGKFFVDKWYDKPFGNNFLKDIRAISTEWDGDVFFNLTDSTDISLITKQWFGGSPGDKLKSQILTSDTSSKLLDVSTKTWSKMVKVNKIVQASNNGDTIRAEAPEKFVPAIGSVLNGGQEGDIVEGMIGWDIIDGGDGSDFIHGGNGRDVITGGSGGDELWGDFGLNTFKSEKDGQKDLVVIKSDHYVYNWLNNSYTNNPNGERTDFIEGLDAWDRIRVTGGYKQDLRFAVNVTHMGQTGIAIYLKDSLEALYTGNDLTLDQIKNMTDGDGSDAAIANSVHQYGLDWL